MTKEYETKTFICEPCKYGTHDKSNYNKHNKSNLHYKKIGDERYVSKPKKINKCEKCGYETTCKSNFNKHVKNHTSNESVRSYVCKLCVATFRYRSELINHGRTLKHRLKVHSSAKEETKKIDDTPFQIHNHPEFEPIKLKIATTCAAKCNIVKKKVPRDAKHTKKEGFEGMIKQHHKEKELEKDRKIIEMQERLIKLEKMDKLMKQQELSNKYKRILEDSKKPLPIDMSVTPKITSITFTEFKGVHCYIDDYTELSEKVQECLRWMNIHNIELANVYRSDLPKLPTYTMDDLNELLGEMYYEIYIIMYGNEAAEEWYNQ